MKKILMFVCVLMLFSVPSFSAEKVLVVASEPGWPPLEFVAEDGKLTGYTIELIEAIGREAGFAIRSKSVPWQSIFAGLRDGGCDVVASSVTITPERIKVMDFSAPYLTVLQAVVTLADDNLAVPSDLDGKVVGVQTGTTGHFAVKHISGSFVQSFDTLDHAFRDLALGHLDAVVCDEPVALYYVNHKEVAQGRFKVAFVLDGEAEEYGFAVRKGDTVTLELLNRGLQGVREKGIDTELARKWMGER
ncbi:basic amino acid ABC transporter substrate-binding protein [Desulfovibrio sp. OttesenSCG-928-I05]|nr:basic amino acid ABC transporter substrate-binding protein [Desulfovibrio sp. OttesenSCG-928-I05]